MFPSAATVRYISILEGQWFKTYRFLHSFTEFWVLFTVSGAFLELSLILDRTWFLPNLILNLNLWEFGYWELFLHHCGRDTKTEQGIKICQRIANVIPGSGYCLDCWVSYILANRRVHLWAFSMTLTMSSQAKPHQIDGVRFMFDPAPWLLKKGIGKRLGFPWKPRWNQPQ